MFGFLKKKKQQIIIGSPVKGYAVGLKEVPDPTFRDEMIGKGAAVIPSEGKIYAPADGTISMVFDTLHAISMLSDNGAEILIHVGLDTVALKGDGFQGYVKAGDVVKKGDLLLTADLEKIKQAGYSPITPVLICNPDAYEISTITEKEVLPGEALIEANEI